MDRSAANKMQTEINSFWENHFNVKGKLKEPSKQAKQNVVRISDPSMKYRAFGRVQTVFQP